MEVIKHKSRKPKPPTGMELSVTFSMAEGLTPQENADAMCKFLQAIDKASGDMGAVWMHIHCAGIPAEYQEAVQAAIDSATKRPHLQVVVDNTTRDNQ